LRISSGVACLTDMSCSARLTGLPAWRALTDSIHLSRSAGVSILSSLSDLAGLSGVSGSSASRPRGGRHTQ
jgi:hypothetical protein